MNHLIMCIYGQQDMCMDVWVLCACRMSISRMTGYTAAS